MCACSASGGTAQAARCKRCAMCMPSCEACAQYERRRCGCSHACCTTVHGWLTKAVVHEAASAAHVLGGVAVHKLLLAQGDQLACGHKVGALDAACNKQQQQTKSLYHSDLGSTISSAGSMKADKVRAACWQGTPAQALYLWC